MEETVKISILNVVAVIISAYFAVDSARIISAVATFLKTIFKEKEDPAITLLKNKIKNLKKELNDISPTNQFAAYFKKDRELNKLNDELEQLQATKRTETTKNLKIEGATRVVIQLGALVLLRYVSGITAFCIPDNIFWPFNFLIRFPAIFGNDTCPGEFAEVSGFALAFLAINLGSRFYHRLFKAKRV
ncbi:unnamed protein product [Caenorhabditis angaria]|uniref:Guided entry of tail-anchored proteins factor 1 n=1 Tax=Caenorhabditis angaria TaxID=860376 RepID=A0A9P1IU12_9PELO|nr:unnamed protein product [Caenorhabditis angaria]